MRDVALTITRNTLALMGAQVITWVSGFVLVVLIPRYLGSVEYGRLYLALSISMMAQVFVEFGGSFFITKEVSREPSEAPRLIVNSLWLRLCLGVVSLVGMILLGIVSGYVDVVVLILAIFGVAKLWEGALSVFKSSFQGFERMEFQSAVSITERVYLLAVVVVLLLVGTSSWQLSLAIASSTLLGTVVGFRLLRRFIPRLGPLEIPFARTLVRRGVPYFFVAVFATVYFRINAIMLSYLSSEETVGWFGAAFRFFEVLMFFPSIFSTAVFPAIARLVREDGAAASAGRKSFELLLFLAIPIGVVNFVHAQGIIDLLFGADEYAGSVAILRALSPGLVIIYLNFVLVTSLMAFDKQRIWTLVALVAIPLSVGLNAVFIPYCEAQCGNGGVGSAIATSIIEVYVLTSAVLILPRGYFNRGTLVRMAKFLGAGLVMLVGAYFLEPTGIPWILQAVIAGFAYLATSLALNSFSAQEKEFFGSLLSYKGLRNLVSSGN